VARRNVARKVIGLDIGTTGHDSRLQYASPPYVQDITETPYRVSQWAEIQNPSGLPA
jgi:hypothetical protein